MSNLSASNDKASNEGWLFTHLKASARSFYLTLRFLPPAVRYPIGLAYLLARIADTLADHTSWKAHKRLAYLVAYRKYMLEDSLSFDIESADMEQLSAIDQLVVSNYGEARIALDSVDVEDAVKIRHVLDTLTTGMVQDLEYFEKNEQVIALKTQNDLERYTYLVAGCVGEFWTDICVQHIPALKHWDRKSQIELGIKFGKALQLTNIIRDIPKDHAIKRCYIPEEILLSASSNPDKILSRLNDDEIKMLVDIVKNTIDYYRSAIDYTLGIPSSEYRLRLACSLPILIGLQTMTLFHQTLTNQRQVNAVKISRKDVYKILLKTILYARWNGALGRQLKNAIPVL